MPMKRFRTCMYIVYISCNEFISRIHSTHALLDTQSVRVFHNFLSFSQWMHCFVCWICIVFFVRPHCCSFHSLMKFFILHFFIKDNKQLWCCNCDRKMNIFKTKQSSHKVTNAGMPLELLDKRPQKATLNDADLLSEIYVDWSLSLGGFCLLTCRKFFIQCFLFEMVILRYVFR